MSLIARCGPRLLLSACFILALPALAQPYPAKPVRIIVPTAPGGGVDLVGRTLAHYLGEALGQQFIVENRSGAGSTIGSAVAAKSPPDGYTLLVSQVNLAFTASYYRRLSYDPLEDFAPISQVATQPFVLAVHPSLPVKSVHEMLSLAKRRPGQIAYGSGGVGSGPHIGIELLKYATGIDLLHVPYRGAGPAFVDLMAGQVQLMMATLSIVMPHAKSGRVRALALTSEKRHAALPALPTVAESGVPQFRYEAWYGLVAPAGTPAAVIERLNAATVKVLQSGSLRARLVGEGLVPTGSTPAESAAHLEREIELWAKVVKAIGQYAD